MLNKYVYYVGTVDNQDLELFNKMLELFPGVEIADSEENEGGWYDDKEGLDYYYHEWNIRLRVDLTKDDYFNYSKLVKAFDFEAETERRAS